MLCDHNYTGLETSTNTEIILCISLVRIHVLQDTACAMATSTFVSSTSSMSTSDRISTAVLKIKVFPIPVRLYNLWFEDIAQWLTKQSG